MRISRFFSHYIATVLVCTLTLVGPALADQDLYSARMAVADEDGDSRNAALSQLLGEVMMRVSGSAAVAAKPAARSILDAAPSLVQQYRYQTSDVDGTLVKTLQARFDAASVDRMMRQQGLPVWRPRPRALLWLATEQGSSRSLLSLEEQPAARAALVDRAAYRGLPLQLPLMDLTDQAALDPADLWSEYQTNIRKASARYPHDLVVTGRLAALSGDKWRGSWTLYHDGRAETFDTPPQRLAETMADAVDRLQDLLAARHAPLSRVSGGQKGTLVRIADVGDLPSYGQLLALLQGLASATPVALRYVDGDAMWFDFGPRAAVDDLRRALDGMADLVGEPGSGVLPPTRIGADGLPLPDLTPDADLYYRLRN